MRRLFGSGVEKLGFVEWISRRVQQKNVPEIKSQQCHSHLRQESKEGEIVHAFWMGGA